jgi:type I restriction enzyme M protein
MLTAELRSKVDKVWNSFWSGGISNPLEIIEQITYLLFLRRLDDLQTLEENKARRLNKPLEQNFFLKGKDNLRWSKLKNMSPQEMFNLVDKEVFPFLRSLGGDSSSYGRHMQGARFTIPTPMLLSTAIDLLDQIPMQDRDTKGDLYEYMLSKIASAGQNGQFRTPRHIIRLMVELTAPTVKDTICDPASGTCGFLVNASEYLRDKYPEILIDNKNRKHFHNTMFHGYDFDNTMLRIGSMNMLLHGVENPDISYRDSLGQDFALEEEKYSLILANPPFAGSINIDNAAKDLLAIVKTKNTELLFLALFLKLLKPGGRAAIIVPDGVLFKSSKANKEIRRILIEDQKLDAIISLPSGVFKPYAGVSTSILLFTKTNSGGTDTVWFYNMTADGWSLDDQRKPLLSEDLLGTHPSRTLTSEEHIKNNLPDILKRWHHREDKECTRERLEQSFVVSREEIVQADYDLSLNRYKEVAHKHAKHVPPLQLIKELSVLEQEIQSGIKKLKGMLN